MIKDEKDVRRDFACNLKILRQRRGMTQRELAEKLGYAEKTVGKWETCAGMPGVETLVKIAAVLGSAPDALLRPRAICFLGIDGGGTKTELLLTDEEGNTLSHIKVGPTNPIDLGAEAAFGTLAEGITRVCEGIPYSAIYAYAGLAGGLSGDTNRLRECLERFCFANFGFGSDNDNIIAAGLKGEDGVSVIMGTGVCLWRIKDGTRFQVGGWGYLFDKGGSGYHLGREAAEAYYAAVDGSGKPTVLTQLLEQRCECGGKALLNKLYAGGKRYIASLAPDVLEAADQGDEVASAIVTRNAQVMAELISVAARPFDDRVKVVLAGGISQHEGIFSQLKNYLPSDKEYQVERLSCAPVMGALKLANLLKQEQ